MKSGWFSKLRFAQLLVLAGFFLYSTSVQEIHFMFVKHDVELNEHCNNHLHAASHHTECSFCKIDLSSYVQSFNQFEPAAQVFPTDLTNYELRQGVINNQRSSISLRGPPALA